MCMCCYDCVQFCDFNSDPHDLCKVISDLQSVGEDYDSFGEWLKSL